MRHIGGSAGCAGPETDGAPVCPVCGCLDIYDLTTRRCFKCAACHHLFAACHHLFSVTSGTILASRKLSFVDLLGAICLFVNASKGLSAVQLSRVGFARERIAPGSTISADEIAHWDRLEPGFDVHRINHSDAYSRDGVHTNLAESFFARLRRMVGRQHHKVGGRLLGAYAAHAAWLEDHRGHRTSPWRDRDAHPGRRASQSNPERAGAARADPSSRLDPSSQRFVRGIPQPDPLPQAVWINPPVTPTTGETAQ